MNKGVKAVFAAVLVALFCSAPFQARSKDVRKEFDNVKSVRINTVSGDCIVRTHGSRKAIVELSFDVDPEDAFDYRIDERGGRLTIKERWRGHSSSGDVIWTLTLPEGAEIEFSTASGDLEATGPVGSIEANTASGDIEVESVRGEVDLSTASGDIRIVDSGGETKISTASGDIRVENAKDELRISTASGETEVVGSEGEMRISTASGEIEISDSRGIFELSCASGEITAAGIKVEGSSTFSTASGRVEVILAETSEYDLSLSTASGDVTLDYDGNEVKGYFEFEARKRRGRIECPFDFDDEEEFEKHDETYVRKWFSRGGDDPEIHLSTASGRIVLKK